MVRFVPGLLLIPAGLITALSATAAPGGAEMVMVLALGLLIALLGVASFLKALAELLARRRRN